jgi:hypothetical protein
MHESKHVSRGGGGSIGRAGDAEQQTAGDTDATQAWEWDIRKRPYQDSARGTTTELAVDSTDSKRPVRLVGVGRSIAFSWRPSCQYIIATLSPPLARQRSDVRGLIGNGLRRSGLSFPSPHAEPHTVCVHAY